MSHEFLIKLIIHHPTYLPLAGAFIFLNGTGGRVDVVFVRRMGSVCVVLWD